MIKLEEHKHLTESKSIERLPLPAKVYLPLIQHLGKACIPQVKAGDIVLAGQKIASVQAQVSAPIHASISGKVLAIQDYPHPLLGRCAAIVIESDAEDKLRAQTPRSQEEVEALNSQQVRGIVLEAGIVGMGGATFPTHIKLNPPKPVDTLVINAAECEPYLTSDYRLMIEKTREIILGIEIVTRCLGAKNKYLAIEDNKPEAIKKFKSLSQGISIKVLPSQYPQGGEKQLIKNVLSKEVPSGKLPFEVGVVVHNVATLFAIYEAVYLDKPLY
ncbi:MAG: RnfABCDGE type electron transport complex subunit C, partial [Candidatus Omnitrophica bacterium]|nr:RnfABCDGE type electron transport complex subunit C [Candidatus Omnitrophota bacterium]